MTQSDGEQRAGGRRRFDHAREYRRVRRRRLETIVEVREPLVLITQIQRSGGTLLTRLFDGHPALHVHPGELHIGGRRKLIWPDLRLADDPEAWFELLFEGKLGAYSKSGYSKAPRHLERRTDYDVAPFMFLHSLQRDIFLRCVAERRIESSRDIFDCYLTSLFNAWLDNQNLYGSDKKAVVAFAAGFGSKPGNLEQFFAVYPDGIVLSIVRDPRGWLVSAQRYKEKYADVDLAVGQWRRSTSATLDAKARWPERVVVLSYEDLVLDTERVMAVIADRIGIPFSPVLLRPTFNSCPIRANSSEPVVSHGVLADRATAHRSALDGETSSRVERAVGDLYEQALSVIAGESASRVSAAGS